MHSIVFAGLAAVPSYGTWTDPLPAADAAAWSLLALLAFCIACFTVGACMLRKRFKTSAPEVVLPKVTYSKHFRPETGLSAEGGEQKTEPPKSPWERTDDWWKK